MVSGSCPFSASSPPCGIENGLCEKSTFLSSSLYSYIGKSTIQASSNRSLSIRFNSSPTLVRARPANFQNLAGSPATKKAASPSFSPSWARMGALRSDFVRERTRALATLAPHDVAEAGLAFALRPGVHAIAEGAAAAARSRDRPDLVLGVFEHAREDLEA